MILTTIRDRIYQTLRVALFLLVLAFYPNINVTAQKAKNVHGTAELILTGDMSRDKAVKQCIELAKINAIKAEFGEKVSLRSSLTDISVNGEASSNFIEESEVITKGIWIADTKEPVVKWEMRGDDFVCIAEVWGKAQEPSVNNTSIEWGIYAGGLEEYCKTFIFKHKQPIYIKFRAAVDGYLAVYLLDKKEANCLLPYKNNPKGRHFVKSGKESVLFNPDTDKSATRYRLTNSNVISERNDIVLIFSPNPFTKSIENHGDRLHPNTLSKEDFEKWLVSLRKADEELVVERQYIEIRN